MFRIPFKLQAHMILFIPRGSLFPAILPTRFRLSRGGFLGKPGLGHVPLSLRLLNELLSLKIEPRVWSMAR